MTNTKNNPATAALSIDDMLDHCAGVRSGQEVLLLAHLDGLHGGDNLVDEDAIAWVRDAVERRGARASVLWINEPAVPHEWRLPPIAKAAIQASDVLINHSFDITIEEIIEFRQLCNAKKGFIMVRNFATTAPLLETSWARTPHELVSEIRYQLLKHFVPGLPWQLTDEKGSHLEGRIAAPTTDYSPKTTYASRREDTGAYRPWPEWVHTPITITDTNGVFVFDRMLSWWSRYIGIPPYFESPIRLTIKDNTITGIEGGREAEALRLFLTAMEARLGPKVYEFGQVHSGVHPQASVSEKQCPNLLYRRMIEHAHTCNVHFHIGGAPATADYPYWPHVTGDTRTATFRVGDAVIHDHGRLTVLDNPEVKRVAEKYPGRPGLDASTGPG